MNSDTLFNLNEKNHIARLRLQNQQITGTSFSAPGEILACLGAIQAQDYAGAKWSLGLRLSGTTDAEIEQAIVQRTFIRTWLMRGTLHFVGAEDIHWMLGLLAPRSIARSKWRHQQLELTDEIFAQSRMLFTKMLSGGNRLTRGEMFALLEHKGISTSGQRGIHILWRIAQDGLICFGPQSGKQQTFVLLDEWIPVDKKFDRDQSLVELARRYFISRGPATLQDFVWWSGLTAAEARIGLDANSKILTQASWNGRTFWMPPASIGISNSLANCHLLPGFDEYLLAYKERNAVLDEKFKQLYNPGNSGVLNPVIVLNGQVVGTWGRILKDDKVVISVRPFDLQIGTENKDLLQAANQYGEYVNLPMVLE